MDNVLMKTIQSIEYEMSPFLLSMSSGVTYELVLLELATGYDLQMSNDVGWQCQSMFGFSQTHYMQILNPTV